MTDLTWLAEAWDMVGENISYEEALGFVLMALAGSATVTLYLYVLASMVTGPLRRGAP